MDSSNRVADGEAINYKNVRYNGKEKKIKLKSCN